MQPSTFLLRTARILFPSLKPTLSLSTASRAFSVLSAQTLRRPAIVQKWVGQSSESGVKVVAEQTRGMVVRSSVKKMCPGCKVCFDGTFSFCDRGEIWSESMFREGWGEEGRVQVVVIVGGTGLRSVLRSAAGVEAIQLCRGSRRIRGYGARANSFASLFCEKVASRERARCTSFAR